MLKNSIQLQTLFLITQTEVDHWPHKYQNNVTRAKFEPVLDSRAGLEAGLLGISSTEGQRSQVGTLQAISFPNLY